MSKIFFSADHHFGHKGVIKHSKRPFDSIEEMNETMITRWNEKVKKNDLVYHLGDIGLMSSGSLLKILKQLNGRIHLIKGNHDNFNQNCANHFEWVKDYYELKLPNPNSKNNQLIILMHYPMLTWKGRFTGACHLHGHSHGSRGRRSKKLCFDIGVDCNDFYPVSYEEVLNIISLKIKQNDQ